MSEPSEQPTTRLVWSKFGRRVLVGMTRELQAGIVDQLLTAGRESPALLHSRLCQADAHWDCVCAPGPFALWLDVQYNRLRVRFGLDGPPVNLPWSTAAVAMGFADPREAAAPAVHSRKPAAIRRRKPVPRIPRKPVEGEPWQERRAEYLAEKRG